MTLYSTDKEDLDRPGSIYKPAEFLGYVGRLPEKEMKVTQMPQTSVKESELAKRILEFGL